MVRTLVISVVGIVLASSSTALAHNTPWAWKPSRAAQIVVAEAVVRLPAEESAILEIELRQARSAYALAEMIASEEGDWFAAGMYHNLVLQVTTALGKVRNGLGIDNARCTGVGRPSKGRFKHFRCSITSGYVEIPSVERVERVGDRQIVVEGPARVIGPLEARLEVHVTGRSSILYRPAA